MQPSSPPVSTLPGHPRSRADCDLLSAQLAAPLHRLRTQISAGLPPDAFASAQAALRALEAAQSFVATLRDTLGPDSEHAVRGMLATSRTLPTSPATDAASRRDRKRDDAA